ncbi:DUF1844 domain-containing protein [Roseibacillus ishigakijimensis]|uniref:DUF1844 domain-containing protein n=1 Tax=Roseibacillus ishigakijimensis TaxID=454146 RepID=A0A934VHL8_9BACT|nr:DUF1844 domain-containing protein [Roseibacillus ishigakijimensis]MBK1834108.1 DUF1844 domain-containing protein [Roseibacillus ishigakijimensis]
MAETLDKRFMDFVLFQAQNAGLFLGKIPNPATGQTSVNLRAAQSVLDSLEMLRDKSKGNLVKEESEFLAKAIGNIETLLEAAERGELGNDEEE